MDFNKCDVAGFVNGLSASWQIALAVVAGVILFTQANWAGEKIGMAIYYLTH